LAIDACIAAAADADITTERRGFLRASLTQPSGDVVRCAHTLCAYLSQSEQCTAAFSFLLTTLLQ
jgi:subtilisin-like proprotein convertase family protein